MAGNEDVAQQGQDVDGEMDKFAGFATKDGVVVKTEDPAPKQNANAKPIGAKAKADATAEEGEPQGKKAASADDRIGQAVGRQRSAERQRDAARAEVRSLGERIARLEGGLTARTEQSTAPKAPNPKDYEGGEYDTKYISDMVDFKVEQRMATATSKVQTEVNQAAQTQQQQAQNAAFQAKRDGFFEAASEKYDDFEDVVGSNDVPISQTIGDLALESEYGADILYELASDVKEAQKVNAMTPAKQASWFGRQEAAKESSVTPGADEDDGDGARRQSGPKSKVSQAPAVPDYNSKGKGALPKPSPATTDFAAFEKLAMAGTKQK